MEQNFQQTRSSIPAGYLAQQAFQPQLVNSSLSTLCNPDLELTSRAPSEIYPLALRKKAEVAKVSNPMCAPGHEVPKCSSNSNLRLIKREEIQRPRVPLNIPHAWDAEQAYCESTI